jgi:choline-sulfatase
MVRKSVLVVAALVLAMGGCKEESSGPAGEGASGEARGAAGEAADPGALLEGHRPHLDLMQLAHLADVDHHGLFIDFGTPARMKYTVGHWRTGWGSDGASGDTTFTYAGTRGRVYFDVAEAGPLAVRMRLRPLGTALVSPYLNGQPLEAVRFQEGSEFRDYDLTIPAERVRAGENELMLVFGGTTAVGDEKVSVAMESIRIAPGTSVPGGDAYAEPAFDSLVGEVEVGGKRGRALAGRLPGTFAFHVHVPPKAKLAFALGKEGEGTAKATVTITPAVGEVAKVFEGDATGAWKRHVVDLDAYADQVVRLELAGAGGEGRVAWGAPILAVPDVKAKALPQAKNVVVLLIDTLRADKLKAFNAKSRVKTPHADAVAEKGTVFELAQSPENWTKPSVASILTSLYPTSHGAKRDTSRLPDSALLLSEHYKANGFSTATFLANGYVSDKFGFKQGWDHYTNYIREGRNTEAGNVFKEAGDWLEKNGKDGRFFVYIQTIDPHVPYDPPAQFLEMYDAREYTGQVKPRMTPVLLERAKKNPPEVTFDASDKRRIEALHDAEISYHDDEMGKFIEKVEKLGLWKDTLFVITSDHGEEFNDHGSWGHGHSTYQELLHVPLLFHQPGAVPAGRVSTVVSTIDIAPTVLELTGVPPMPAAEGTSLAGYFRGQPPARPAVAFSDFLDDRRVITTGRWKLVLRGLLADFFDLEEDPGEKNVLQVNKYPVAMRYCRVMLGQFLGATNRARWLEGDQGKGVALDSEDAQMDDTIREQLKALGYAH